jgi:hypothetical protein
MEWALTAVVLCSVSLLVVALTLGQGSQTLEHRSGMTVSAGRSLVVLRHILLSARAVAITAGHRLERAGRIASRRGTALAVAVGRAVQGRVHDGFLARSRRLAAPATARRRARATRLRFEDCLQMTGPMAGASTGASRSTLSLAPLPASGAWLSRLLAALELVVVIAVAGGAIAFALIAAGWKASGLF